MIDITKQKDVDRFWSKVDKTDKCWMWNGNKDTNRRGYFFINKQIFSAHRLSFIYAYGDIPSNMCVCHTCDVGLCVNPDHMFLGTHQDNMEDKMKKGRHVTRSKSIPVQTVLLIRRLYISGVRKAELSRIFDLPLFTIRPICDNKTYRKVNVSLLPPDDTF